MKRDKGGNEKVNGQSAVIKVIGVGGEDLVGETDQVVEIARTAIGTSRKGTLADLAAGKFVVART